MKTYTYKVVGVTFDGRDGNRQKVLKKLWNAALKEELLDLSVSFEEYYYEGQPATLVFFDGLDVGNIPAGKSEDVRDIRARCENLEADLALSGMPFDDYLDLKEAWASRRQDLKDGIIDEFDIDDMRDQLAELKEDPIYSATVTFYIKEPEDDLPPEPQPGPEKKGLFSRLLKK